MMEEKYGEKSRKVNLRNDGGWLGSDSNIN